MTQPRAPTPSDIVYLFGDQFAPREKPLRPSESVPCNGTKVQRRELAQEMVRAAFAHLERDGAIALTLGQRKTLIFKSEAVIVASRNEGMPLGGIEQGILEAVAGDAFADEVVGSMIGEDCIDPWAAVIEKSREHLLSLGYFTEEGRSGLGKLIPGRTLKPQCERIAALRVQVPVVQVLLGDINTRNSALERRLREDIKKGVISRYQTREIDAED